MAASQGHQGWTATTKEDMEDRQPLLGLTPRMERQLAPYLEEKEGSTQTLNDNRPSQGFDGSLAAFKAIF